MRLLAAAIMGAAAAATPEPSVAVAVVACGRLAGEALFGMCVRSLRGPGAFAGVIYALTDRPACAPATTTVVAVSAERDGLFRLGVADAPRSHCDRPRRYRCASSRAASRARRYSTSN